MRSVTMSAVMGAWAVTWDDSSATSSRETNLMGLNGCMGCVPMSVFFLSANWPDLRVN